MESVEGDPIRLFTDVLPPLLNSFSLIQVAEPGLILLLLLCSALFSIAETAFFSLSSKDVLTLRHRPSSLHRAVLSLHENPARLQATIFITNTLITVIIALLGTWLVGGMGSVTYGVPALLINVVLIAFVLVLFSEAMPKSYAVRNNILFASIAAYPLQLLSWLFRPFTYIITCTTRLAENRMRRGGPSVSIEDIRHAIEMTSPEETTREEKKILRGVVKFGSTYVRQIMRSRRDIVAHDVSMSFGDLVKAINENHYSRLPIYNGSIDQVVGILYIKDLVPYLNEGPDFQWSGLVREPYFVQVDKKIDALLQEFKQMKVHMAIVRDEENRTAGLVTMEDIVEEIVGDIRDEFDEEEVAYSRLDDNTYVFDGRTSLDDVIRIMDLPDDTFDAVLGQAETIGSLVSELAGRIPLSGQTIKYGNFALTAELTDRRRVRRVKVSKANE